jgi:hypothetical protein
MTASCPAQSSERLISTTLERCQIKRDLWNIGNDLAQHQCRLWVISRHFVTSDQCPLYPQKQTSLNDVVMSAKCHKRTHALQQFCRYLTPSTRPKSAEAIRQQMERWMGISVDEDLQV